MTKLKTNKRRLTSRTLAHSNALPSKVGKPHVLHIHDSIKAFMDYAKADSGDDAANDAARKWLNNDARRTEFEGDTTHNMAAHYLLHGNARLAEQSKALLARLSRVHIATKETIRISSPVGGKVCVPAMLSGSPVAMRRRKNKYNETAPLDIVYNASSSMGISAQTLETVGVAVAALVQKLSATRQVNFYLCYAGMHCANDLTSVQLIKFATSPMDASRLAFAASDQIFPRVYGFAAYAKCAPDYNALTGETRRTHAPHSGTVDWPFESMSYISELGADLKKFWGNDMLYIKALYLDELKAITRDPVAWVEKNLRTYQEGGL